MLIIDQTAGEVEESKLTDSEADLNVSEPLITGKDKTNNNKDNTNNKDITNIKDNTNNNNNNNKIIHVAVSEVAENESKKSKPSDNINIHESTDVKDLKTVSNGRSPKSAAIILTIGLTVHNILEGVAIGLSPSQEKLIMILIGICPHNLLESF